MNQLSAVSKNMDKLKITKRQLANALDAERTGKVLKNPKFAVVAPIVFESEEPYLLIEVRASGIPQAGDPCFPGGKIEKGETPAQAASREMKEELGVDIPAGEFLGQLPTVHTYLGSLTSVYVCSVPEKKAEKARINPAEVSELLKVPMSLFLRDPKAMEFPFGGHVIWGMTAGAIRNLCEAWRKAV